MARLAERHIKLNAALRKRTVEAITRIWYALPDHRNDSLASWLETAPALVEAARRQQVAITEAYIARALDRPVIGVSPDEIMDGYRNGADPQDVYKRPFSDVWTALSNGTPYAAAAQQGLARAVQTAATDVQMAMRDTSMLAQREYGFWGYQRVANGDACAFCQEVDGAYVKGPDLVMDLHPGCGCGLEVMEEPHKGAALLPDGTRIRLYQYGPLNENVTVVEHGELGSVLADPSHDFSTQQK